MPHYFHQYTTADISPQIRSREGETKLGEVLEVPADESIDSFLKGTTALFVVIGISEDIGVLANYGKPGTAAAWNSFVTSFLNIQANEFTNARPIALLGHFTFEELKNDVEKKALRPERISGYRKAVIAVDDAVSELVHLIVTHQKVPIIIGGGHNNCYPILKGTATALSAADRSYLDGINCVNLDAHFDYRLKEGRHSGNGFRYAKQGKFLRKYFALGIHENYVQAVVLNDVKKEEDIAFTTYEEVFIRQKKTWSQSLEEAAKFVGPDRVVGIELDLDSIAFVPSSAATPCGITSREALQYIDYITNHCKIGYLHICEGIATSDDALVGKLISYLAAHFVKTFF
jgi:formiminoglutamase